MDQLFHTYEMPDIPSWIYPCFPIGISDPCDIESRNLLWWVCMTSSILDLLGTLVPSHLWIELDVPLNLLLRTLRYVRVHIVVEVPVSVKPIRMYLGELVHPQQYSGALTLPVAFLMNSLEPLMCTAAVSHLVFSEQVCIINEVRFWSNQWEAFLAS